MTSPTSPGFNAVLYPNSSLPRWGAAAVMGGVAVLSLAIGTGFFLAGAWPVAGVLGGEVLLFLAAFALFRRDTKRREVVRLDAEGLHVQAIDPAGHERRWRLEPTFTRVLMDDPPKRESRLVLTCRGHSLIIGRFLTPDEKLDFARSLRSALREHQVFR